MGNKAQQNSNAKLTGSNHWVARIFRGGSRAAATSKMERFVIIVNDFQPLTIVTKRSILNVAAALDPPLILVGTIRKTKRPPLINYVELPINNVEGTNNNKVNI